MLTEEGVTMMEEETTMSLETTTEEEVTMMKEEATMILEPTIMDDDMLIVERNLKRLIKKLRRTSSPESYTSKYPLGTQLRS